MTPVKFIEEFDTIAEAPGGIERLRELVLQLAVRGKLVPQDEGDEPASRLLEQIAEEKARLERAKEIGKQKPVPPMEDSATAVELPKGWTWTCTAALGIVNPRNVAEDDAMVSFCPMPTIPTDYRQQVTPEIRHWGDIKKGYTHFADGDVVVAKITPCFQNRKSCVMTGLEGGIGAGTTELHVIRIIADKVVPEYLLLFYRSPNFLQMGVERMTGTAGQQRVPREYFAYTPLPLPPLAEQHRIVAKVDELMGLIDRLEAARRNREDVRATARDSALAALRNATIPEEVETAWTRIAERMDELFTAPADLAPLREAVLQLAVQGRLVPQDEGEESAAVLLERIANEKAELVKEKKISISKPLSPVSQNEAHFEVPQNWMWVRLGSLYHLEMGQSPSSQFYNQTGYGLPFYQGKADFGNRFPTVRYWCTKPTKIADKGDVLLSVRAPIGPTNIATESCCIGRGLAALRPLAEMPTEYLLWTLRAFEEQLDGLGTGTTFKAVSRKLLEPFPLPLPPLAEQHRIVAKVDELMGRIDRLEQHLVVKAGYQEAFAAAATNVI